jgi:hypothetical protein
MPDEPSKPPPPDQPATARPVSQPGAAPDDEHPDERSAEAVNDRGDRGISDFVRRAVSAGVGAASRSKDDIMRVAATEVRNWLEAMNMNDEIVRALSKMVIEVKTEIRFRPSTSDDGKVVPETTNEIKFKGSR